MKQYEKPEMTIKEIAVCDIIITSSIDTLIPGTEENEIIEDMFG